MADYTDTGSGDRLSFTFFLAAALHAMLIFGLGFSISSGQKIAPTLNITLATHKDVQAPEKADFLAQHNQLASGTADEIREITARELASIADIHINEVNPIAQQKATTKSRNNTQLLSTQTLQEKQISQQPSPDKSENQDEKRGEDFDAPLVNPEFASLQAKVDRIKWEQANKPRVRRLISVSTKSSYDAAYLNTWTQKIEAIGNNNFPEEALTRQIFGHLRLAVLIDRSGAVKNIDILESSGYPILDDAARQIVRLAAPFERFPPEILQNTDQLEIIRTWRFELTGLSTGAGG